MRDVVRICFGAVDAVAGGTVGLGSAGGEGLGDGGHGEIVVGVSTLFNDREGSTEYESTRCSWHR